MAKKVIRNEEEAIAILRELMKTPQAISIHFEADFGVSKEPIVTYEVKRHAYKVVDA